MPDGPKSVGQLLGVALHSGTDGGDDVPLGDAVLGMSPADAQLVLQCHRVMQKQHDMRHPASQAEEKAATEVLSLELFYTFHDYGKEQDKAAGAASVENTRGYTRALLRCEFASRLWCLMHALEVDGSGLPSAGYLEFFRGIKTRQLLPIDAVNSEFLEGALAALPSIAQCAVLDAAEDLQLVSRLYLTLTQSMHIDDPALQSQVAVVARDFSTWVLSNGATFERFVVGLAKTGRTTELHNFLVITRQLGIVGGLYDEKSMVFPLVEALIQFTLAHPECMRLYATGDPDAHSRFAGWVSQVQTAYSSFWDSGAGQSTAASLEQQAAGSQAEAFVRGLLSVFDCLAFSQSIVSGPGRVDWKEALALALLYMAPNVSVAELADFVTGKRNLFLRMGMGKEDLEQLDNEDQVLILVLQRRLLDMLAQVDRLEVPALVCHMLEVVARLPEHSIPQRTRSALRDRAFATYAGDLFSRAPGYWKIALDYLTWGGGEESQHVLLNTLDALDVTPQGLDNILRRYDDWAAWDSDGLILRTIKGTLAAHGHRFIQRGLLVEGVKRLLQGGAYDAVEEHVVHLLSAWALDVLRSGSKHVTESCAASPVVCLANACASKSIFKWPSAAEAQRRDSVFFSRPPTSFLDVLALTPSVAGLVSASRHPTALRDAALNIVRADASPTALKLAALHLLVPLMNDAGASYFSINTVCLLASTLEEVLDDALLHEVSGIASRDFDYVRLAITSARGKACCHLDTNDASH